MTSPEGRVLLNVDEFMLRLGHLSVLADVADDIGGNEYRVTEEFSDHLTKLVDVAEDNAGAVAEYVRTKGLCNIIGENGEIVSPGKGRYPDLAVQLGSQGLRLIYTGTRPQVWWQDYMLSDPRVRSRVGAVTVSAKSGSRTGVSHVLDWAVRLDLISRNADALPESRLITRIRRRAGSDNPYVLGIERLVYAWAYVRADFDIFSGLVFRISDWIGPLKKREAAQLYAEIVVTLVDQAEQSRTLSNQQKRAIFDGALDLERASKGEVALGASSTAWHRTSSRVETLVDLELLAKGDPGSPRSYEYYYVATDRLRRAASSLRRSGNCRQWLDDHLCDVFGPSGTKPAPSTFVAQSIATAVSLVGSSGPLVAIDHLVLGLAVIAAEQDLTTSLSQIRAALIGYAKENPETARLSSGRYGREAEFISVRQTPTKP